MGFFDLFKTHVKGDYSDYRDRPEYKEIFDMFYQVASTHLAEGGSELSAVLTTKKKEMVEQYDEYLMELIQKDVIRSVLKI